MRIIRNEIQTPRPLVAPEKRHSPPFFLLMAGIALVLLGLIVLFFTYYYSLAIEHYLGITFQQMRTWTIGLLAAGILMYILAALILRLPLRKTTYYAITTILRNEPFDPPRRGNYTPALAAKLQELGDEWVLLTEVCPPGADTVIPQVLVGPGGVFAMHALNENPVSALFKDPGAHLARAAKKLSQQLNQPVAPIIVLPNPKMVVDYKKEHTVRTRLADMYGIREYLEKREPHLNDAQCGEIERQVYALIQGTPPGV